VRQNIAIRCKEKLGTQINGKCDYVSNADANK
jgi:hypothetical protein